MFTIMVLMGHNGTHGTHDNGPHGTYSTTWFISSLMVSYTTKFI